MNNILFHFICLGAILLIPSRFNLVLQIAFHFKAWLAFCAYWNRTKKMPLVSKNMEHSVFLECFSLYLSVKWYFDESQWMASCLSNTSPSDLRLIIWIIQGTEIHLPHVSPQSSSFNTQGIMWLREQSVTCVWILHKSILPQTIILKTK